MNERANLLALVPDQGRKLSEIGFALEKSLGESLAGLVHHRASQMNGCAFCLDMDVKKARIRGERDLKMFHINVWRESNLFSDKERIALELTEAITKLSPEGISDDLYDRALKHFDEKQLAEFTFHLGIVNTWNRLNIVFRSTPGARDKIFGLDKADM